MAAVGKLAFQRHLHQFLCRWGHGREALTERNNGHALIGETIDEHLTVPWIEGQLPDLIHIRQFINLFFDGLVIDHVSVRGQNKALLLPEIVVHMVGNAGLSSPPAPRRMAGCCMVHLRLLAGRQAQVLSNPV